MLPVVLVAVLPMSRSHLGAASANAEGSWAGFLPVTVVCCSLLCYPSLAVTVLGSREVTG